jgi:pSer/pThr/pTyr-binding forkhead associated (FHA) protein
LAPARLVVTNSGADLPLPAAPEAIVGRADPVSNYFPDIDLTPHGALDNGVGRRHMRIFLHSGQFYLEDLDSTNGTFFNNQRLAPRSPQLIQAGESVMLGKLTLRLEF